MTLPTPLRAVILLLLAALALAACADDEPATDEAEEEDTAAEAEPDEAEDTPEPDEAEDPETADDAAPDTNLVDGCVEDPTDGTDYFPDKATFDHAERVDVTYADTHKVVEVETTFTEEPLSFVLVQCGLDTPELDGDLAEAPVIEVPVDEAITLTTANLAHFDALDAVDRLAGVGTTDFVTTEAVRDRIETGELEGYGTPEGPPETERLVDAAPDVAILDAFGETILDDIAQLGDAGVAILANADFDEPHPLGRAEWVKVTGLLLNREADAQEAFEEVEAGYTEITEMVADADDQPRVLLDAPFEGTWFAAGGQSLTATLIADAGGEYVFDDDDSTGSLSFDIETVLDRGADADVWLGAGSVAGSMDDLLAQDERFGSIDAAQEGEVWAGDAMVSPEGGNARFERGAFRVDELLADFAAVFHPELIDHDPIYYGQVGEAGS